MELKDQVHNFIAQPVPLWDTSLTHQLVHHKWRELERRGFQNVKDYSTAGFWLRDPAFEIGKRIAVADSALYVEMPSFQLQSFYNDHGLELLAEDELEANSALLKLSKAMYALQLVEPIYDCIINLVRTIHVLRQPDEEVDLSYSHPQIPFSVFVSVCKDDSAISSLRVAESILHESMHLKLTLIEEIVPLVKPSSSILFYSPWRDQERPVKGVLHGLFVFRAIMEFYNVLFKTNKVPQAADYVSARINGIENEIAQLRDFPAASGLTEEGANLVISLLPLS